MQYIQRQPASYKAYMVVDGRDEITGGVYHYLSRDHLLEQRCAFTTDNPNGLLPTDTLLLDFSAIHWR